ncbi:MAG: hypothetical protein AB7O52_10445 [Planctomycetota bacterium]
MVSKAAVSRSCKTQACNRESCCAPTFEQALDRTGRLSPVADLQQTGIDRVRVVSRSQLAELTRVAVNRAIRALVSELDLPADAMASIHQRAEVEYGLLVAEGLEVPQRDWRETLATEGTLLDTLANEGSAPAVPEAGTDVNALEARVVRNLTEIIEKDWQASLREVQQGHQRQIDLLEARIAKLVNALESTDRMLQQLHQQPPSFAHAPGNRRAGAGRHGLDPENPLFEKKSQLLAALFAANKELRQIESSVSTASKT